MSTPTAAPTRRGRKTYSEQFKTEAMAMVTELGKPITTVARELEIAPATLHRWLAIAKDSANQIDNQNSANTAKLEAEIKRLRMENEFLKKAAAFFAKESE